MYSYSICTSLFEVVLGGARVVYRVCPGKESPCGLLSLSSMEQFVGMLRRLGRRGGEMWDGGSILCIFLRVGKKGVSGRS